MSPSWETAYVFVSDEQLGDRETLPLTKKSSVDVFVEKAPVMIKKTRYITSLHLSNISLYHYIILYLYLYVYTHGDDLLLTSWSDPDLGWGRASPIRWTMPARSRLCRRWFNSCLPGASPLVGAWGSDEQLPEVVLFSGFIVVNYGEAWWSVVNYA